MSFFPKFFFALRSYFPVKFYCPRMSTLCLFPWYSRRLKLHRVKIIGRGCYAVVYLALYTDYEEFYEEIAVKTAKLENAYTLQKESRAIEDFYNCPEIVRGLGHEYTVESGVEFYNLLLEYTPLGTLFDLIQRSRGFMLSRDIRIYTSMILKGLHCIHAKGYVHCDLKPENILVFRSQDGYRLKIADFGLVKEPGETLSKRYYKYRFRGTPLYMSPESVAFGEIEPALDIWSLGCIVVQMITGKHAWQYGSEYRNHKDILYLLAFTKKIPQIPECVMETGKDFLQKCFERDPRERWSAQMLLDHPYVREASGLTLSKPVRPMPQFSEKNSSIDLNSPTLPDLQTGDELISNCLGEDILQTTTLFRRIMKYFV